LPAVDRRDAYTSAVDAAVLRAIVEDGAMTDVTSVACVPADARARAQMVARVAGVVAGLAVARAVFASVDEGVRFDARAVDGDVIAPGQVVAQVEGLTRSLLAGERIALNFVQQLSGVATLTRAFVDRVAGTGCRILDTRKTTPGLRVLERAAVRAGGGVNHRLGLFDMILIKDNHVAAAGGVVEAVRLALARRPTGMLIEVETTTLAQVEAVATMDVDRILVDNMDAPTVARAVAIVDAAGAPGRASARRPEGARRWPEIEASGGITLATARGFAETGVDYLSVGALTHSAPALDLALELAAS
jgi:nicotinate-nucleotide pyrophosphorylase (carboxylating)